MSNMTNEELAIFLRATFPTESVGPITRAQRLAIHAAADRLAQAIEAQRAGTTKIDPVADESAVGTADAPKGAA